MYTFWHAIPTSFYIFNVFKFCSTLVNDDYQYATDHNRIKGCYHRDSIIQKGIGKQSRHRSEDCLPPALNHQSCGPFSAGWSFLCAVICGIWVSGTWGQFFLPLYRLQAARKFLLGRHRVHVTQSCPDKEIPWLSLDPSSYDKHGTRIANGSCPNAASGGWSYGRDF